LPLRPSDAGLRGTDQDFRMSLLALLAALLLEQLRPLPQRRLVDEPLSRLAAFLESRFNAGEPRHGIVAWLVGVGALVFASAAVHAVLAANSALLAWLWNVAVLYLTTGFQQYRLHYTEIQIALRLGDEAHARHLLAAWRPSAATARSASDLAGLAIEELLCASHRRLFAVVFWFLLLPGPAGAVLYRAAAFLADFWGQRTDAENGDFASFARRSFAIIDWLPSRCTAAAFAIVGNFEDAVYSWRTHAEKLPADGTGIVLASGAGALGLRLGQRVAEQGDATGRIEIGCAEEADVDSMASAVGLVWRGLLLCLLLLLLVGLAGTVGG